MKIFLDLDNVLIHTSKFFREDAAVLYREAGISKEAFEQSFEKFSTRSGKSGELFTPERHLAYLGKSGSEEIGRAHV